jgi:hypothetical protein
VLRHLGLSFWAAEANLNLLTRRELTRLVTEALRATGRSGQRPTRQYWLLGLSSNLILWIAVDTAP